MELDEENMENASFITPEGHEGFLAKKLFDEMGKIQWGAVAYIEKDGGGPIGNHGSDTAKVIKISVKR